MRYPLVEDWKGRIKTIQINFNIINTTITERIIEPDFIWLRKNGLFPKGQKSVEIAIEGCCPEIQHQTECVGIPSGKAM
jgi:hypothetical protein